MFGGRPAQKKPNSQANTLEFDIDNIDHLLHDNFKDNDNVNDDDFNDPELLSQLNALASSSSKMESQAKVKKPAKKVVSQVNMEIDLDSYTALTQGDDDIEVELDENDFSDPTLLNELSSLSQTPMDMDKQPSITTTTSKTSSKPNEKTLQLMNMGFSEMQAMKALNMFDNDVERATNYLLDSPIADDDDDYHHHTNDNHMDQDTNLLIDVTTASDDYQQHSILENKKVSSSSNNDKIVFTSQETVLKTSTTDLMDKDDEDISNMDLKAQSQHYQQLALAAKKQGDKKLAVSYLRESKALMQLYQQQQSLLNDNTQDELNNNNNNRVINNESLPSSSSTKDQEVIINQQPSSPMLPSPSQQQQQGMNTLNTSSSLIDHTDKPSSPSLTQNTNQQQKQQQQQELLQLIIQLQKEYKEAAIHYKNLGNLSIAKEMIQTSKSLLKTGIQVKQEGGLLSLQELTSIKTKLPSHPDMTLGDGKLRTIQPITSFQQPTIEQVESQLTYQIDVCHNLEIQYRSSSSNIKLSKDVLEQQRNALLPLKQAFAADLMTIKSLSEKKNQDDNNPVLLPSLHYEQVDYSYNNISDHLASNQMELKIVKGSGIQNLDIGSDVEPFVTWDFAGWPPENTAQAQLNKGETPIVKGINPVFDFTTVIPIVRTNRVFIRHIQRKKLTLELYHNKYSYGFLRRPVLIGKITIPLEGLLTKSSINGWFDLIDGNRKKFGGKLEIQLNIREPLNGQEIIKRSERWLILDGLSQQTSQLLYSAGLTQSLYNNNHNIPNSSSNNNVSTTDDTNTKNTSTSTTTTATTTETISTTDINKNVSTSSPIPSKQEPISSSSIPNKKQLQKEKISSPTTSSSPDLTSSELENAEDELNNVDNIVSNMVLEHEIGLATAAISGAGGSGSRSKEDWIDRKQALDIKMNMLIIQVQTGMLDMDAYLKQVENRMEKDRQLALIFKKNSRLDLAKVALTRKKIMQDELDEAKAAMAAQQEDE